METSNRVTRQLAEFAAGLRPEDVPDAVKTRAKHLILDALGCGLVGAKLPWSKVAVNGLAELDDGQQASVWGWDRRATAGTAALLNGTFVQGFELDDYYEDGPLHSGAVVVPALFAGLESGCEASGDDVIRAAVVGFEIGPRLGRALDGYELLSKGWHCGAIYGVLASAATAAALRNLDADATEDALGIAGTQASGLMAAQYEAMVKRMHHGFASRNGLVAAALAANGYTGIKDVLERPYGGMRATFNPDADLSVATEGIGDRWELTRINVKPYAAMAGLHPAVDAALALRHRLHIKPTDIANVTIEMPLVPFKHGGWTLSRPPTVIGAQMNCAYATAAVFCDGEALVRQFTPERINADDVWSLIERIDVRHSTDMDELARSSGSKRATRMTITTTDGRSDQEVVVAARGAGAQLLTNEEIVEKFQALVSTVLPDQQTKDLQRSVLEIDEDAGAAVIAHLATSVGSLFSAG